MRCMLCVICCRMYILGSVDSILGVHSEDFWGCMCVVGGHLGPCWGHLSATLGGLEGYLGPPGGLGFRV